MFILNYAELWLLVSYHLWKSMWQQPCDKLPVFQQISKLSASQGLENVPHDNLDAEEPQELLYEGPGAAEPPMPVLSPVRTGRSPHFGTPTASSESNKSPELLESNGVEAQRHTAPEMPPLNQVSIQIDSSLLPDHDGRSLVYWAERSSPGNPLFLHCITWLRQYQEAWGCCYAHCALSAIPLVPLPSFLFDVFGHCLLVRGCSLREAVC